MVVVPVMAPFADPGGHSRASAAVSVTEEYVDGALNRVPGVAAAEHAKAPVLGVLVLGWTESAGTQGGPAVTCEQVTYMLLEQASMVLARFAS